MPPSSIPPSKPRIQIRGDGSRRRLWTPPQRSRPASIGGDRIYAKLSKRRREILLGRIPTWGAFGPGFDAGKHANDDEDDGFGRRIGLGSCERRRRHAHAGSGPPIIREAKMSKSIYKTVPRAVRRLAGITAPRTRGALPKIEIFQYWHERFPLEAGVCCALILRSLPKL